MAERPYAVPARTRARRRRAVREFGFKRYVDDVFYYPIPTGGPLYEQFLQLVCTASRPWSRSRKPRG